MSLQDCGRGTRDQSSQRSFEPGDVPILAELPADAREDADLPEPEPLVQRDRRRIRLADGA